MADGTYRLYGRRGTGSAASEAALAEVGAAFEVVEVPGDRGLAAAQGYLGVNPRGQVPALALPDGTAIAEGTAILLHLADVFPEARLAPPPGSSARARHDRWLLFFQANLYEGELRHYFPDRYVDDPDAAGSVMRAADAYVKRHYVLFETEWRRGAIGSRRTSARWRSTSGCSCSGRTGAGWRRSAPCSLPWPTGWQRGRRWRRSTPGISGPSGSGRRASGKGSGCPPGGARRP